MGLIARTIKLFIALFVFMRADFPYRMAWDGGYIGYDHVRGLLLAVFFNLVLDFLHMLLRLVEPQNQNPPP